MLMWNRLDTIINEEYEEEEKKQQRQEEEEGDYTAYRKSW